MLFFASVLFLGVTDAAVNFAYSTIYDVSDFEGKTEVRIPKCDKGCLIFASTLGGFLDKPDKLDPYARNMFIVDNGKGGRNSFTSIAGQFDQFNYKIPLEILGPISNISMVNQNGAGSQSYPIVLYVIDRNKAKYSTYTMYDASNALDSISPPYFSTATIMSAQPFSVKARREGAYPEAANVISAWLTGFENAMDANDDGCPYAYKMPATGASSSPFPGFHLQFASPIVSFSIGYNHDVKLDVKLESSTTRDLSEDGFIASAGYNGCANPTSGGHQNYQSTFYKDSVTYSLTSATDYYKVSAYVMPSIDGNHDLTITDYESDGTVTPTIFRGVEQKNMDFPITDRIEVNYSDLKGGQGFIMRYQTSLVSHGKPTPGTTTEGTTITTSSSARNGVILLIIATAISL